MPGRYFVLRNDELPDFLAAFDVPTANGFRHTSGEDSLAVGRIKQTPHRTGEGTPHWPAVVEPHGSEPGNCPRRQWIAKQVKARLFRSWRRFIGARTRRKLEAKLGGVVWERFV